MEIKWKKLSDDAVIPQYATEGAAGFDLHATKDVTIRVGETIIVPTDLAVELPAGVQLEIRPRSGLSAKTPLLIKNSPGTIDMDYRGNIGVVCHCLMCVTYDQYGEMEDACGPVEIKKGDRIAQGVLTPYLRGEMTEAGKLTETERGEGGFGSTGN